MKDEKPKKRRYGPVPREKEELRGLRLSVYFTAAEMERLKDAAGEMQPAAYLRSLAFEEGPVRVPEINKKAWSDLGRAAGNLNRIAMILNAQGRADAKEIKDALARFRRALIGVPYEVENHKR